MSDHSVSAQVKSQTNSLNIFPLETPAWVLNSTEFIGVEAVEGDWQHTCGRWQQGAPRECHLKKLQKSFRWSFQMWKTKTNKPQTLNVKAERRKSDISCQISVLKYPYKNMIFRFNYRSCVSVCPYTSPDLQRHIPLHCEAAVEVQVKKTTLRSHCAWRVFASVSL